MGICCSCSAHRPATTQDQDPSPSTADHVSAGSDEVGNSWLSIVSTSITTWMSQPSSSFTTIWGKNVPESSQFSDATESGDGTLANGQNATDSNVRVFTLAQLRAATYNFRSDLVIGKGGFGNVYRGWLKEKLPPRGIKKTAVAIKKLASFSMQGLNEWKAEVYFSGTISHPNLVKLLGYCSESGERILVYEFMKRGSLNYHLFGKRSPLSWDIRLKIAIDTARGLAYLHTLEKPIIYRDFKSSNILLDEFYNARLSDFGLSFWGPLIDSHVSTRITGTIGYIDPQYLATGNLHVKSDVYGFGVVMVELLTGLRAIDMKRPSGKQILVDWVKPYLTNRRKLKNIMDSRLEGKYPPKEASQIALLAFKCLQHDPRFRPSMTEIAETLEQIDAIHMRLGLKVAVGIAQGLAYLHSPEVLVIHRDLKSSDILLDKSYTAKISDFGLASVLSPDDLLVETHVIGTDGYAAPEIMSARKFCAKSDVYSFGVVLVEMLTGLRAIDNICPNGQDGSISIKQKKAEKNNGHSFRGEISFQRSFTNSSAYY